MFVYIHTETDKWGGVSQRKTVIHVQALDRCQD